MSSKAGQKWIFHWGDNSFPTEISPLPEAAAGFIQVGTLIEYVF